MARYTVAKCHAECGDWQACLQALGEGEADDRFATIRAPTGHADLGGAVSLEAAVYLLRGRACAELDNRAAAIAMYRAALKLDPYCYEALAALLDNHMLTNQEELALVAELPIRPEDGWLHTLYRVKCKKVRL